MGLLYPQCVEKVHSVLPSPCPDLDRYLSGQGRDLVVSPGEGLLPGELGLEVQSGRVRFQKPVKGRIIKGGAVRGKVALMSDASRRRLMAKFASLDYEKLASSGTPLWFITLTTPPAFWKDTRGVYLALRRFRDSLEYDHEETGYIGALVRRELGAKSGMLHYHMVVVGGSFTPAQVSDLWTRSLRSPVPVRVDVQALETAERVAKYLSKYCSKVGYDGKEREAVPALDATRVVPGGTAQAPPLSEAHNVGNTSGTDYTGGRWWYIWGASRLPWGRMMMFFGAEAYKVAAAFKRIFKKWLVEKKIKRDVAGFRKILGLGPLVRQTPAFEWGGIEFPGIECSALLLMRGKSRRKLEQEIPFVAFLGRSHVGYTFLLSPDLLQKMLQAACQAVVNSPARFPWEIA